jgi:hypothetical protein
LDERTSLLASIDEAKLRIAAIKKDFGLEAKTNEVRRMIAGHLSSLWESVHNTRPANLGGFGPVEPTLYKTLDPELMRIIDIVNTMLVVVSPKPEDDA